MTDDLILVVDDDPDMRELLRRALRDAGFSVVTAADGSAALAFLQDAEPDLILLDAIMPPPDGFALCRAIKMQPAFVTVPVMFMTGLGSTEHVVAGLQAGGVDYMTKPPLLDELVARVRVHIASGRTTRSAQRALDSMGRMLLSADVGGSVTWASPRAIELLDAIGMTLSDDRLTSAIVSIITGRLASPTTLATGHRTVGLASIGPVDNEYFFRITEHREGAEAALLREALRLTPREADVMHWIAAGKSNRDISDILNISIRTVEKHLEQIFVKLGVENRAAAAAIATRILAAS